MDQMVALVDLDPRTTEDRLKAREELCRVPFSMKNTTLVLVRL